MEITRELQGPAKEWAPGWSFSALTYRDIAGREIDLGGVSAKDLCKVSAKYIESDDSREMKDMQSFDAVILVLMKTFGRAHLGGMAPMAGDKASKVSK